MLHSDQGRLPSSRACHLHRILGRQIPELALKTAHDNSEQAWLETQEEGRVTRQAFKQYFMNKARLPPPNRVAPPVASAWVKEALETTARKVELSGKKLSANGKYKASESIAWYDHVLDLLFTAGLRMMLPNTKDTLGC